MAFFSKLRKRLLGPAKTASYRPFPYTFFARIRDLPLFRFETIRQMLLDPTIRLGLSMRAAPLQQAEFAYPVPSADGKIKYVPGIKAENPEVAKFVLRQLRRIWKFDLQKILMAQTWGWSSGEVLLEFKDGQVQYDRILSRHPMDVLALRSRETGDVQGARFRRLKTTGFVDLTYPKCFWHAYNPEGESAYGWSVLRGCHSPWADKWLNGGALDVRRLFAHKDAYGGIDIGYPTGTSNIEGKGEVPNRDIAREWAEQIKAGGVTSRPSTRDNNGNEMWPITRATIPSNPTHIFDYPKDLDVEILRGMEIPDEVLVTQATGAWQGKQVPMQAFFTAADVWLAQVIRVVQTQIIEPLILMNFGSPQDFLIETKPLALQAMEQIAAQPEGTGNGQTQPGQPQNGSVDLERILRRGFPAQSPDVQQLSLDGPTAAELLVGRGVVQAADLVAAGRDLLDRIGQNGDKTLAS